jgi:formylglycine-generating enzyme required for sulfatase activity
MNINAVLSLLVAAYFCCAGANAVTIRTVPIGNPGNPGDVQPQGTFGSVPYNFRIGTTEVTNAQYVEFLNAVAATDTYFVYKTGYFRHNNIVRSGSPGSFTYAVKPADIVQSGPLAGTTYSYDEKPVAYVSSGDAMRFANWLHNGQPTGAQNASTTEDGAYTLNGAVTNEALVAVTRNAAARWWLPNEDEWYKAAYYDGLNGGYYAYPTGNDSTPNNNHPASDTGNSANYSTATDDSNYPMTNVGAYMLSKSPYGTFDQGGNVWEWNETHVAIFGPSRGLRGGSYSFPVLDLQASTGRNYKFASGFVDYVGFRVAGIPEPGCFTLGVMALLMLSLRRWTMLH